MSLIDNVYSDMARLRGFYGRMSLESGGTTISLTEARSGQERLRWPLSSIKRWFCPRGGETAARSKTDKEKIVVVITNK